MRTVGGRWWDGIQIGVALFGFAGGLPVHAAQGTPADPLAVSTAYGAGVHAFHSLDYARAHHDFTAAIEAGTDDPRAFYYRGLAALKLGRTDEAVADFADGASREAGGAGSLAVSRALERVQGPDRLCLEQYRARARVAAVQRDESAIRGRYSDIYDAEADVLRRVRPRVSVPPPEPVAPPAARPTPPAQGAPRRPRLPADGTGRPALPRQSADPADPFGDDPVNDSRIDHRDKQLEERGAERDDVFDQRDQQMEDRASERDNSLDQRDAQEEREAAGGF
ncbi:MAG: hypothetical protein EBR86_06685 [Planctomycetia bacterium]|nr:hypothetical protein [Planctomycetia bacterium]